MAERDRQMAAAYGVSRQQMHENLGFADRSSLPPEWSGRKKVGAIFLGMGSPVLIPLAFFALLLLVLLPYALVMDYVIQPIDRAFNATPFSPGRWETSDGEYWIDLEPDGTGEVLIFEDAGPNGYSTCAGEDGLVHESVVWTFDPGRAGYRSWAKLEIEYDDPGGPCDLRTPRLVGGGVSSQYDWSVLHYSAQDPDFFDATFHKVDAGGL